MNLVLDLAGKAYTTTCSQPFTYHQKIARKVEPLGELVINKKEKSITKNTVLLANERALEIQVSLALNN